MAVCEKCGSKLLSTGLCSNWLCENAEEKLPGLWEFVDSCSNIIVGPGINWFDLYQVTEEQLIMIRKILESNGSRHDDPKGPDTGLPVHFARRIDLREWYHDEELWPGKEEKSKTIKEIKKYKETGEFTGIAKEAYDNLLVNLEAIPDFDDVVGYSLHIHY